MRRDNGIIRRRHDETRRNGRGGASSTRVFRRKRDSSGGAGFDPGQIKEISITDVTALTGGGEESSENTLWVDDVQFALNN